MSEAMLRERVYSLATRLSGLGIGTDILTLSYFELEALYRFLARLDGGG